MRTLYFSLVAVLLIFTSCQETIDGNGNVTSESRILEDFTEVRVDGVFKVVLLEGDPGISIETDENLIPHIKANVKGNRLNIDTEGKFLNSDHIILTIYYDELEEFRLNGAGEVETHSKLHASDFHFELNGAGNADLELDVDELEIVVNGGGEIVLTGVANEANYDIAGAGEVLAMELQCKVANVEVAGAGDLELNVSEELDVDVSGAGDVIYIGSPKVTQSISGAGSITQKGK